MHNAEIKAYELIIEMILSRRYAPGDRLIETEISENIGFSRTPVRNAMRKLAAEGLLDVRGNKGCYIPKLSPEDMSEVFKARAYLEGKVAMEAAYCRSEKDIQLMRDLLYQEKEYYSKGKHKEYAAVNDNFHLLIGKIARNSYIEKFMRQVFWRSGLYIFYFDRFYVPPLNEEIMRDPSKSVSCVEHEKILNAIVLADGELAENSARAHVYTTYSKMAGRIQR
ncbi:MAG: GntR family transcriptional regulator [Synergistaceae bacterium]|nr:GntR family transcriptional regulator [Synergistaceae bacterium]